jgi:exo-beta-1,3-glucanase (GH17 family)
VLRLSCLLVLLSSFFSQVMAQDASIPLFQALIAKESPKLIAYTPSELDPRQPANQLRLKTSSIRADLEVLRPAFDGLVLYGFNESTSHRILSVAKDLNYRVILLAVWDIKSSSELDGVAALAKLHQDDFALGVLVGNEGITFNRYEREDLAIAATRLRKTLPTSIPIGTSEPLVGYQHDFIRDFGDFLAPNVHPFFDAQQLDAKAAAAWAKERAVELAEKTGKPVILKETGFPYAGREKMSLENQAAFWKEYREGGSLERSKSHPKAWTFFGVAFEAFDAPWKAQESGLPVEKSWGLFDEKRQPHPAFEVWKK